MSKYILPILLVGIGVASFVLFTDPVYKEVKALQAQEQAYDRALTNSKQLQAVRDELTRKYNSFSQRDLDRLEKLLPDSPDNIHLIIDIDRIASQYGMVITNVKFDADNTKKGGFAESGSVTADKNYDIFELEFSTTGSYTKFISFIQDIEQSLRIIDINLVEFSSLNTSGVPGSDVYRYDMKIRTYWLKK